MLTPAQPVSSNIFFAACGVVTSPLPMTGMVFTACTTARMPARFTVPPKPCSRVRPCTKIAATPASSSTRARSGAVRLSSSQPRRILAVTGIFTALTMPRTSAAVLSSSVIIAEPPPTLQTFFTGQPMLMSTDGDAERFDDHGGVAHFLRHAAEELHGERPVGGAGFDELERLGIFFEQRAGVDEVGRGTGRRRRFRARRAGRAGWCNPPAARETDSSTAGRRSFFFVGAGADGGRSGVVGSRSRSSLCVKGALPRKQRASGGWKRGGACSSSNPGLLLMADGRI